MFDLCRELSHHNEALENPILSNENSTAPDRSVAAERDMLAVVRCQTHGKLSAINEVIQTAIQER